jgi:hypothetical protein
MILKRLSRKFVRQGAGEAAQGFKGHWREFEYFDDSWRLRIKAMARHIPPRTCVMDLGCGKMWLRELLRDCEYIPVDCTDRGPGTIVCDFNAREFPSRTAGYAFVSGCLEYLDDPVWFAGRIAASSEACILSYCALDDFPDVKARARLGWRHNFRASEVVQIFGDAGMRLAGRDVAETADSIFIFKSAATRAQ